MKWDDKPSVTGIFFWLVLWPAVAWALIRFACIPLYATGGYIDGYFATVVACFVFRMTVPLGSSKATNIIVFGSEKKNDPEV